MTTLTFVYENDYDLPHNFLVSILEHVLRLDAEEAIKNAMNFKAFKKISFDVVAEDAKYIKNELEYLCHCNNYKINIILY